MHYKYPTPNMDAHYAAALFMDAYMSMTEKEREKFARDFLGRNKR